MLPSPKAIARKEMERRTIEDGTAIWRTKKKLDMEIAIRERQELRNMLATYNPWGKPGNGAPMPGALRKTKWMFQEPAETVASVLTLGRPGHGAPLRTISGKIKTLLKSDPSIRFQGHESNRRSVENDLRYKASPTDKENYRKQLDAIINEKHNKKPENATESKVVLYTGGPEKAAWGRPGPGGRAWRDPKKLGRNFLRSMGWTDEVAFRRLVRSLPKGEGGKMTETDGGGGVELVPLLAKNRMVNRSPLSSTDVTKISKMYNGSPKAAVEENYQHQLSQQIHEKQNILQKQRREDAETSRKHFETWKGFWGRPGHGAPKGLSQREKLDMILYYIPAKRTSSGQRRTAN